MTIAWLRGRLWIGLALGMAVVVVIGILADLPRLLHTLAGFELALLPAILGLTLVNYALRFGKWEFFLRVLSFPRQPLTQSCLIFFSGLSMVVTPGKIGEWLKSFLLRQAIGVPVSASAPIIIAERLSDGLAMAVLASGGLVLYGYGWQALAVFVIGGLSIVAISQYRPLGNWVLATAARLPFVGKRVQQVEVFYASAKACLHWRPLGTAIAIGIVSWSAEGVAFYLVLLALGEPPSATLLFQAVFILAASTIVGAVSMLPGGLAVAEGSIAGLLLVLHATNDPAIAAAATIIIRFATLWFGVTLGILALSVLSRRLDIRAVEVSGQDAV